MSEWSGDTLRALGVDPGRVTGLAVIDHNLKRKPGVRLSGKLVMAKAFNLAQPGGRWWSVNTQRWLQGDDQHPGDLYLRLYAEMVNLLKNEDVGVCVVDAGFHGHANAVNSHQRFVGVILTVARYYRVRVALVPPATAKKWATGSGRSGKDDMATLAAIQYGVKLDHNAADALWLADMGQMLHSHAQHVQQVTAPRGRRTIKQSVKHKTTTRGTR